MKNFLASSKGIILVGCLIGILAPFLQYMGNPPNMGLCVACFERDIAGALGFHSASVVQYIRPEIIGLLLGAYIISLFKRENFTRGGSSPMIRFFLGIFAMIGALVFLGCPWRTILRIAGGDLNALIGIAGLIAGIYVGTLFLKTGFSLGRAYKSKHNTSWVMPLFMVTLLILLATNFKFGQGAIFFSEKGPGSMHANMWISLVVGLFIGGLVQRSRFCTMGAFRDIILMKDFHLLKGVASMLIIAFAVNMILGQFNPGYEGQPIAHTNWLWNFLGMVLSGLSFALSGGCPGRQLILAGEGDSDAGVFVMGMIVGAGIAHNFALASSPKGITPYAPYAVIIGLAFALIIGFSMRIKFKFKN